MIVIAEIGINHNGSLDLAHELIRQARIAGADIAKFQFYDPYKIFGPDGSYPNAAALAQALTVQFGFDEATRLKAWCDEEGIEFMASVFDLERFDWTRVARRSPPQDRQSGGREHASSVERILGDRSADVRLAWILGRARRSVRGDRTPAICTACPSIRADTRTSGCRARSPIPSIEGFSDHTIGIEASLVAVGRGARIIEKHFTLNKGLPGPDHVCSATPESSPNCAALATDGEAVLMKAPDISVVVTNYNYGKYIRRCLRSLLNQDLDRGRYEVIVVDDHSTDDSLRGDRGVQRAPATSPWSSTRRTSASAASSRVGVDHSRGKYFVRVDADDYVQPPFLSMLYNFLRFCPELRRRVVRLLPDRQRRADAFGPVVSRRTGWRAG